MAVAAAAGTIIPFGLRWMHLDPAVGSGVLVSTATDILGFLLLLGLATALPTHLT